MLRFFWPHRSLEELQTDREMFPEQELMVVVSPPRTKPLVAMADVDRPVMVVTTVAIRMMAMVSPVG